MVGSNSAQLLYNRCLIEKYYLLSNGYKDAQILIIVFVYKQTPIIIF